MYFLLPGFLSQWGVICADHSCLSAWMNSDQIKLALAHSDLHQLPHTQIPGGFHSLPVLQQHLLFHSSLTFELLLSSETSC